MPPAIQKPVPVRIYSTSNKPNRERSVSWGDDSQLQQQIEMRLDEIDKLRQERKSLDEQDEIREATIKALKRRAFHLPCNKSWCQDWRQYLRNNHPFFGVCLRSSLSPIGFGERIIGTAISLLIGITVTNGAILWGLLDPNTINQPLFSFSFSEEGEIFDVTYVLLILWTGVSCVHAIHDTLIFYFWCMQSVFGYVLWLFLWIGAAILITALVSDGYANADEYNPIEFCIFLGVEVFMAWIVWYPLVATILFSGILGCKRFPVLGGRPRQVRLRQQELQRKRETTPMNTISSLVDYDASTIGASRAPY